MITERQVEAALDTIATMEDPRTFSREYWRRRIIVALMAAESIRNVEEIDQSGVQEFHFGKH